MLLGLMQGLYGATAGRGAVRRKRETGKRPVSSAAKFSRGRINRAISVQRGGGNSMERLPT